MLPPGLLYEEQRLQALQRYDILDTPPESEYDDLVQLAARLCEVPMALISLVDRERQWFKANVGLPGVTETERCISFCTFAIEQEELLVVEDATKDARFASNPLVTGGPFIRFYAGAPIRTEEGFTLGTLCVIDLEPRALSEDQRRSLLALKRQVELLLRLRLQVKQTQERDRQLMESSGDAVFLLDEAGRVVESNPVAARLLGRDAPALLGTSFEELAPESEREPLRRALHTLRSRGTVRLEQGLWSAQGERVVLDIAATLQEVGSSRRLLVVGHDLTEKRRLEQQSIQNDRLASVGALAAGIAHEINNPIAYVLSNVSYLQGWLEELERSLAAVPGFPAHLADVLVEAKEVLSESLDGCTRIRDIVRDMRSFSHASDEALAPVDVNASLDFVLRMAWSELKRTATLEKDYAQELPAVFASESRLGQVFLNLIINAIQAMQSSASRRHILRVRTVREGEHVRIDVSDTGHGIAPEVLPHIFDPFFTTKPAGSGTGLGLSISHSLVRKMGGELRVRSAQGQGTTFSLLLPMGERTLESSSALVS
ncbi:sensor histidine kinase [Vitiosangium sp. GDMCC 1.1324]|uniref:sensor histidine kinase n=1 Tax=Vitiosangium sp. (strain GDMCC 1.1324) TaxID=2138576 RepID=UPI000D3D0013|nr:sensor histidine kinase [Vitiosangium sp. GDMCC 1.1324]PTL83351.1 histidine kinase [Vitiosangium sp. GDMCC 1.1324]